MTTQLTPGNDIFDGTDSDDTILGLDGNDIIRGLEGNDIISGNQRNDQIFGGLGDDSLYGGKEDDIVQGGAGNDYVFGDLGNDTLWGDDGNDFVFGGLGNDLIYGNRGNDVIYSNEGDDTLYGGKENDTLFGGRGNDFLSGDLGNDVLFGDEGMNTLSGGSGNDIFVLQRKFTATTLQSSDVILDFTKGQDKIGLTGDLAFEELAIYGGVREYLGDTIIQDKTTGRYFAVLKNMDSTTLTASDFTTNLTPVGSTTPEQVTDPTAGEDTLSFEISEYGIEEGGQTDTQTITVQRDGPARGIALVDYATVEGTARAGSDFQATGGNLIFNPGELTQSFTVRILDDLIREPDERFFVELRNPAGSATIGTSNRTTIVISDNDSLPQVQFTDNSYTVNETDRTATITVTVNGVSETPFTVEYGTRERTAIADQDYVETSGILSFIPGQTIQSFTVPILQDNIDDANETIALFLTNPSAGAILGTPADATLTIL